MFHQSQFRRLYWHFLHAGEIPTTTGYKAWVHKNIKATRVLFFGNLLGQVNFLGSDISGVKLIWLARRFTARKRPHADATFATTTKYVAICLGGDKNEVVWDGRCDVSVIWPAPIFALLLVQLLQYFSTTICYSLGSNGRDGGIMESGKRSSYAKVCISTLKGNFE